jgi:hypothetical protein
MNELTGLDIGTQMDEYRKYALISLLWCCYSTQANMWLDETCLKAEKQSGFLLISLWEVITKLQYFNIVCSYFGIVIH